MAITTFNHLTLDKGQVEFHEKKGNMRKEAILGIMGKTWVMLD